MVYSSRPTKRARTAKHSKGRSKSRQSRFRSPPRQLMTRQLMPEIKRRDHDINFLVNPSDLCLFQMTKGSSNNMRTGNSVNMHGIKVHYDFGSTGLHAPGSTNPFDDKTLSVYLVRDVEGHAVGPANYDEWMSALFSDPLHSKWNNNFRNPDYVNRFQIVRKVDLPTVALNTGTARPDGFFSLKLNGAPAKYETRVSAPAAPPINTRYYVVYNIAGYDPANITIRIREEWFDN